MGVKKSKIKKGATYILFKKFLKKLGTIILPANTYENFRTYNLERRNRNHHITQRPVFFSIGGFTITLPSKHLLIHVSKLQPKRDLFIGTVAKIVSDRYPDREIVDIGANIGDTAAIIASQSNATMILIEGSDFYFNYLNLNAKLFPNKTVLHNCLILDGQDIKGTLIHWGGLLFLIIVTQKKM